MTDTAARHEHIVALQHTVRMWCTVAAVQVFAAVCVDEGFRPLRGNNGLRHSLAANLALPEIGGDTNVCSSTQGGYYQGCVAEVETDENTGTLVGPRYDEVITVYLAL